MRCSGSSQRRVGFSRTHRSEIRAAAETLLPPGNIRREIVKVSTIHSLNLKISGLSTSRPHIARVMTDGAL